MLDGSYRQQAAHAQLLNKVKQFHCDLLLIWKTTCAMRSMKSDCGCNDFLTDSFIKTTCICLAPLKTDTSLALLFTVIAVTLAAAKSNRTQMLRIAT